MSLLPVVVVDHQAEHGEEHGQLEEDRVHQDTGRLAVQNSNYTLSGEDIDIENININNNIDIDNIG